MADSSKDKGRDNHTIVQFRCLFSESWLRDFTRDRQMTYHLSRSLRQMNMEKVAFSYLSLYRNRLWHLGQDRSKLQTLALHCYDFYQGFYQQCWYLFQTMWCLVWVRCGWGEVITVWEWHNTDVLALPHLTYFSEWSPWWLFWCSAHDEDGACVCENCCYY